MTDALLEVSQRLAIAPLVRLVARCQAGLVERLCHVALLAEELCQTRVGGPEAGGEP